MTATLTGTGGEGNSASSSDSDSSARFAPIDAAIEKAIADKHIPGAVVLIGHKGKVVYHRAYGNREVQPAVEPMTEDTIFDIASLTKCVATGMSVARLLEQGQIKLNDTIGKYVPEFAANGKQDITLRELLTHHSGLAPDLDTKAQWRGKEVAFRMIAEEKPVTPPGSEFEYSDINFEILGILVERVSGMPLNEYAAKFIFEPLKMHDTRFLPPPEWRARIAPTNDIETHRLLRGEVHDPTAQRMGGVAGHAGLFSTAADLSKLAQALLDKKVLDPLTIEKMITPQQPAGSPDLRGLAWDIDTPFSSNRGELLPVGSYGHTGFTGTSLWIDPYTQTYVVLLTNAVHPLGMAPPGGGTISLRTRVASAVAAALKLDLDDDATTRLLRITGYNERAAGQRMPFDRNAQVLNGIDVLEANGYAQLKGKTIGLLTNQSGLDLNGQRTIDVLAHAPGVKLAMIFSPEHGVQGKLDTLQTGDEVDATTGVKVYSVYGGTDAKKRPRQEWLAKLDAVVIDLQDVGARFYTYETSLGYFMEEAARAGKQVIVLDRPDPLGGVKVQGPVSDTAWNFANYHAMPIREGMTMGELAQLYNGERKIGAKLTVVPMQGWQRGDWFDSTGQTWVNLSPNMRSMNEATLYTGVAIIEGTNISVGRGTDTPFEVVGAPWIKSREFAEALNARRIAGVRFVPVSFTPTSGPYANQLCNGVNVFVTQRDWLDAPEMGVELAGALIKMYPNDYKPQRMIELLGNQAAFDGLVAGEDPRRVAEDWRAGLERFEELRKQYLIYK